MSFLKHQAAQVEEEEEAIRQHSRNRSPVSIHDQFEQAQSFKPVTNINETPIDFIEVDNLARQTYDDADFNVREISLSPTELEPEYGTFRSKNDEYRP